MQKAQKFLYAKEFVGEPKLTDFKLVEEELPPLGDGDVLVEAECWSVDPYMRKYMARYPVDTQMIGAQIAKVLASNDTEYSIGSYVFGLFGWRTHTVFNPIKDKEPIKFYPLPSFGTHPRSLGLGVLGRPGNSAYFGFLTICQPKSGDVVVVSGAAGAVGHIVGQLAKINGAKKVIGIAGDNEKCKWLKDELGFDETINYKTSVNIEKELLAAAPDGVDCYFDNVGGEISSIVLSQMRNYGRISVCGAISSYNLLPDEMPKVSAVQSIFVAKQLSMKGFLVASFADRWFEGINEMNKLIQDGKLKYYETITDGFVNMPQAFIDMLNGKNTGKAIVKA